MSLLLSSLLCIMARFSALQGLGRAKPRDFGWRQTQHDDHDQSLGTENA